MNCKNCDLLLEDEAKFCTRCGSKVLSERITAKKLYADFALTVFGWDNKYFKTLGRLITRPEVLVKEYLDGVRKRYVPPPAFFAIGMAVALITFNLFADQYIELTTRFNEGQSDFFLEAFGDEWYGVNEDGSKRSAEEIEAFKESQRERNITTQRMFLRYFNILSFLMLPVYALISLFSFRRVHNYGEHLVINAYFQGMLFLSTTVMFLLAVLVNPNIYFLTFAVNILYYLYAFRRIYKLNAGGILLAFVRFLITLVLVVIAVALILFVIAVIVGLAQKIAEG